MRKTLRSIRRMLLLLFVILSLLLTVSWVRLIMRRATPRRMKIIAQMMQGHLKAMARVCGLRIHLQGPRPELGQSFLLLSHHVSYWDILVLGSLFPVGFMAKDSIASWPILGPVVSLCNTIYVRRECVTSRWRSLRLLQRAVPHLSYCVFPEGTTTSAAAPRFLQWRRGNIAVLRDPGVPLWLAGLHYAEQGVQAWIDDDALLPHLFKALQAISIEVVVCLEPLVVGPGDSPRRAAHEAWSQTTDLCLKAQSAFA
ncbi:MAG TPA: lysophospholipid acyltransferase family protein [Oligoflexus sp.]|uniref:lysophospholipid acyltransferase family protein n=1 Tax=Oligoflexus sp. TaxID=1971216 RepID=UPI002D6D5623|nr:lysophospholipid acyltransferase family protein [Oligoflexus sp.]HYX35238.1 lysophospholipid acyltransferase family protein [Oligoflexus sp.]